MRNTVTKIFPALAFLGLTLAPAAMAQFGGRPGDVVIYMITPRNQLLDFQAVPPNTTNNAQVSARYRVVDINTVPITGIPEGYFPPGSRTENFRRQLLNNDPDDCVFLVSRKKDIGYFPHRVYTTVDKTQIVKGTLRELEAGLDAPAPFYVTLHEGSDFGADIPMIDLNVLFWTPSNDFPAVLLTPPFTPGYGVPPGLAGWQWNTGSIKVPPFIPWFAMRKQYPGAGWLDGIDSKFIEKDTQSGNTTIYLRLRPGRATPTFRFPGGNVHLFILQGSVNISANGTVRKMNLHDYAYVPGNFVFSLFNPNQYRGPIPGKAAVNAAFSGLATGLERTRGPQD